MNRVQGMWHVKDVRDVILIFCECNAIYVEEVEDRSNTPKGCNAMYVKDVEDGKKNIHTHIFAHNFLNIQPMLKIDQIHLRAVMPMYVEDIKDGKRTYTYIFAQHHLQCLRHTYHYIAF